MMAHRWQIAVIAGFMACHANGVLAGNTYYDAASGNWTNDSNWSDGVPTASDVALIGDSSYAPYAVVTLDTAGAVADRISLGATASATGILAITSGDVTLSGYNALWVGASGWGELTQNGGAVTIIIGNRVNIGMNSGANGNYTLNSGTLTCPYLAVGGGASGTLTQTGGAITPNQCKVGDNSTGVGTYNLSGGTNTLTQFIYVGEAGNGTLNISGGLLKDDANAASIVGNTGTGTVIQTGGRLVGNSRDYNPLKLGGAASGEGYYQISDGAVSNFYLVNGESGVGTFECVGTNAVIQFGRFIQNAGSALVFDLGTGSSISPIECLGTSSSLPSSLNGTLSVDAHEASVTGGALTLIDYAGTLSGTFSSTNVIGMHGSLTPGTAPGSLAPGQYFLDYGDGTDDAVTLYWLDPPTGTIISVR